MIREVMWSIICAYPDLPRTLSTELGLDRRGTEIRRHGEVCNARHSQNNEGNVVEETCAPRALRTTSILRRLEWNVSNDVQGMLKRTCPSC